MDGEMVSIARLDAWVATAVRCLVKRESEEDIYKRSMVTRAGQECPLRREI